MVQEKPVNQVAKMGPDEIVKLYEPHLPCILLIDTSASMGYNPHGGEPPIEMLNRALVKFKQSVSEDLGMYARQCIDILIIEFNDSSKRIGEWKPIEEMDTPTLTACGATNMNDALIMAVEELREIRLWYNVNGVQTYRPWLVVITGGEPTSCIEEGIERVKEMADKGPRIIPVGAGPNCPMGLLRSLSNVGELAVVLSHYEFDMFFSWLHRCMRRMEIPHCYFDNVVELPSNLLLIHK